VDSQKQQIYCDTHWKNLGGEASEHPGARWKEFLAGKSLRHKKKKRTKSWWAERRVPKKAGKKRALNRVGLVSQRGLQKKGVWRGENFQEVCAGFQGM